MPRKSYDQLDPTTQRAIDSRIFVTEVDRIINRIDWFDERDCFVGDPPALVEYLRGLYAFDCQTNRPRYYEWHSDAAQAVRTAKRYQNEFVAGDGVSNTSDLIHLLTNLPYPEQGEALDRQR